MVLCGYIYKMHTFLLPPILLYQLSGYRMGEYIYFELLFVTMFINYYYKEQKDTNPGFMTVLGIICGVLSTWRAESIIYLFIPPLFIVAKPKKILNLCYIAVISIFTFMLINSINSAEKGNSDSYKILATLRPGVEAVRSMADEKDPLLNDINIVIDVGMVLEENELNGEELFYAGVIREGHTEEEYRMYIQAIVKICIKEWKVVMTERIDNLIHMFGIKKYGHIYTNVIDVSSKLYDDVDIVQVKLFKEQNWKASKPINISLRRNTILLLGCSNYDETSYFPYQIIWNSFIPFVALIGSSIYWIKKKNILLLINIMIILKTLIIIITSPSWFFFYMLSTYLFGWIMIVYVLIHLCGKRLVLCRAQ